MTDFLPISELVLFVMKNNPHPQTSADITNLIRDIVRPDWRKEGLAVLESLPDLQAIQAGLLKLDSQDEPRLLFFTDMGRWKLTREGLAEAALVISPTYKSLRLDWPTTELKADLEFPPGMTWRQWAEIKGERKP